jgi:CDP-4-dehydro-6-deoxyglucose reductase
VQSLELHVRAVPGGQMSAYWFAQARPNDLLRLSGPLGTFFLRETAGQHLVFLATGTGIAPVQAMLDHLLTLPPAQWPQSVSVYWGGRMPADLYLPLDQHALALGWPHARYGFHPVLSRAGSDWAGARGYVQQAALQHVAGWANTWVYACGADAMIQDARQTLVAAGLDDARFLADAFVCSASV